MTTLAATLLAPLDSLRLTVTATTPLPRGALRLFVDGKLPKTTQTLHAHFEGSGWQVEVVGWQRVGDEWGAYIIVREL